MVKKKLYLKMMTMNFLTNNKKKPTEKTNYKLNNNIIDNIKKWNYTESTTIRYKPIFFHFFSTHSGNQTPIDPQTITSRCKLVYFIVFFLLFVCAVVFVFCWGFPLMLLFSHRIHFYS